MHKDFSSVASVILRPVHFLFYLLSGFIRRDPYLWVFGTWSGKNFSDNTAALFTYVHELKERNIRPIWITKNPDVVKDLRQRGMTVYGAWSLQGIRVSLRAGVYVFDCHTKDINHWLSRGAKCAMMMHGVGIKCVERAITQKSHRLYQLFHGNLLQRSFWTVVLPWHHRVPDFSASTSAEHSRQSLTFFNVPIENSTVTGFPRNDQLFEVSPPEIPSDVREWIDNAHASQQKVFMYMPTFRDHDSKVEHPFAAIDKIAERAGIKLLMRLHFVDSRKLMGNDASTLKNIHFAHPSTNPNSLYRWADGLISDYSSAMYDFMLTRKPVIFYVPDLEKYQAASRSLWCPLEEVAAGPIAQSDEELEAAIREACTEGTKPYLEKYEEVLYRFQEKQDANSCKRVYEAIQHRFVSEHTGMATKSSFA